MKYTLKICIKNYGKGGNPKFILDSLI